MLPNYRKGTETAARAMYKIHGIHWAALTCVAIGWSHPR